jgi:acyl-CoA synthetase (AMP-forming)/AMP-acid ligase II
VGDSGRRYYQQDELCTRGFLMKEYYKMPVEKYPQYFKFVSEYPMTGSGKVQKFRMAEMAKDEYKK